MNTILTGYHWLLTALLILLITSCSTPPINEQIKGYWLSADDPRVAILIGDSCLTDFFEEEAVYSNPYTLRFGTDSIDANFPDAIYIITSFGYSKQHYRIEKATKGSLVLLHTEGLNLHFFHKKEE